MEKRFSVWDKTNNQMLPSYGVLAKIEFGQDHKPNCVGIYEYRQIDEEGNGDWDGFEVRDFELLQHIGKKAKDGRDIKEGDILKTFWQHDSSTNFDYEKIGVVIWWEEKLCWALETADDFRPLCSFDREDLSDEDTEIIGNKFKNPELLPPPIKDEQTTT